MPRFTPAIACSLVLAGIVQLASVPASACLWDRDTLATERLRFPSVLELITGKFLRHSAAFYRWRVGDREKRIAASPSEVALYDDLAAAYDKLGEHGKAIDLMLRKEAIRPGLYETYANLGTFYIHAGDLSRGAEYIEKAIAINPDAHFGREVYQLRLVRYVQAASKDGRFQLPLGSLDPAMSDIGPFTLFLLREQVPHGASAGVDARRATGDAVKGILGMMRFGNHRSPVLLEALGDLLLDGTMQDARALAARAYLKASYEAAEPATKAAYRLRSARVLHQMRGGVVDAAAFARFEAKFRRELADAERWYARVEADEARWIAAGLDPEVLFERKYYREPRSAATSRPRRRR